MSAQHGNPTGGVQPASTDVKRRSIAKSDRPLHSAPNAPHHRTHDRLAYEVVPEIVLDIQHPGGTTSSYLVQPRNISIGGMSLNHGGFIAPRTPCVVRLIDLDGQEFRVEGRVLGCRCVGGRLHDVGVSFNEPIELEQFVDPHAGEPSATEPRSAAAETFGVYHRQKLISISRELCGMAIQDASLAELRTKLAEIVELLSPGPGME